MKGGESAGDNLAHILIAILQQDLAQGRDSVARQGSDLAKAQGCSSPYGAFPMFEGLKEGLLRRGTELSEQKPDLACGRVLEAERFDEVGNDFLCFGADETDGLQCCLASE